MAKTHRTRHTVLEHPYGKALHDIMDWRMMYETPNTKNIRAPTSWGILATVSCDKQRERQDCETFCLLNIHFHVITICENLPERLQRCTCPNRTTSQLPERLHWGRSSPLLFPQSASPQTCTWQIWWSFLCKSPKYANLSILVFQYDNPLSLLIKKWVIFVYGKTGSSLGISQSCIIVNVQSWQCSCFFVMGFQYLHMQKWMSSGQKCSSLVAVQLCHWGEESTTSDIYLRCWDLK